MQNYCDAAVSGPKNICAAPAKLTAKPTGSSTRDHGWSRGGQRCSTHPQQIRRAPGPFAHIEVQLHPGWLDIVTQVVSVDAFATEHRRRLRPLPAVADAGNRRTLAVSGAPAPALHRLTVGALRAVAVVSGLGT